MAGRGRGATLPAWMTQGEHNLQAIDLISSNRFEDTRQERHIERNVVGRDDKPDRRQDIRERSEERRTERRDDHWDERWDEHRETRRERDDDSRDMRREEENEERDEVGRFIEIEGESRKKRRHRRRGRSRDRRQKSKSRSRSRDKADESEPESHHNPPKKRRKKGKGGNVAEAPPEAIYTRDLTDFAPAAEVFPTKAVVPSRPPKTGFRVDWSNLCENIDEVWSGYDSGFLESPSNQWYLSAVKRLLVRDCYKMNLESFIEERYQRGTAEESHRPLLFGFTGSSGIGMSAFLQFFLVYLIHEAKSRGEVYTLRLSVTQGDLKPPFDWRLHTDGQVYHYHEESVDYYLSDAVDISAPDLSCVKTAVILVSSASSDKLKQFEQLPESNLIALPTWSLEELRVISPSLSLEESEIRYAVFGGSPRHYLGRVLSAKPITESYTFIETLINWFFHDDKAIVSVEQWKSIIHYLVRCFSLMSNRESLTSTISAVKALMWHSDDSIEFFYASRFLSFVAQDILAKHESNIREAIGKIVGGGYWYESCRDEYLGLRVFLGGPRSFTVIGKSQDAEDHVWHTPRFKLRRFHKREEITQLEEGTYGIPTRADFPFIDGVIQPDKFLCFANGKHHRGQREELEGLRGYLLEKDRRKHKFIWVIDNLEDFILPGDHLGDIAQYVMCYNDYLDENAVKLDTSKLLDTEKLVAEVVVMEEEKSTLQD